MPEVSRIKMCAVIALVLLLHATVLNYISVSGVKPDLLLIVVVFLALFFGSGAGLEAGILAGLGKDMLALDYLGMNTLSLGLTGFVVGAFNSKFFKESRLTRMIIVFFFSAFSMSVHLFAYNTITVSNQIDIAGYAISPLLCVSIYTAIVAVPAFSLLEGFFGVEEQSDII